MKRNVSVVCLTPNCCDTKQRSASQLGSVASGTHCICNISLSGIFPPSLKCAEIKPLFKGDKNNMANYRLIPTSFLMVL